MITFDQFNAIKLFSNMPKDVFNVAKDFPFSFFRCGVKKQKSWRTIFSEGDECHFFYFVLSGEVVTLKTASSGKSMIENVIYPGNFFGGGCLSKHAHTYTAMGKKDTTLLMIEKRDFWSIINSNKELQKRLYGLQEEGHEKQMELVKIITGSESGLVKVGLMLAFLHKQNEGAPINFIHQDLADITRMSREAVTRKLGVLKEYGYVQTSTREIIVQKKINEDDLLAIAEKIKIEKQKKKTLKKGRKTAPVFLFKFLFNLSLRSAVSDDSDHVPIE